MTKTILDELEQAPSMIGWHTPTVAIEVEHRDKLLAVVRAAAILRSKAQPYQCPRCGVEARLHIEGCEYLELEQTLRTLDTRLLGES